MRHVGEDVERYPNEQERALNDDEPPGADDRRYGVSHAIAKAERRAILLPLPAPHLAQPTEQIELFLVQLMLEDRDTRHGQPSHEDGACQRVAHPKSKRLTLHCLRRARRAHGRKGRRSAHMVIGTTIESKNPPQ
jgi:hypothetical protein